MQSVLMLCAVLLWTAELGVLSVAHNIRVELLRSSKRLNDITLICRNSSVVPVSTLDSADFWVNSTDQPLTSILSNYNKRMGRIQFFLHPGIEGLYYCGNISADLVSSNSWTLVAHPTQSQTVFDFYTAEVGSSITLSCPFARGALTQFYSYSWKKGFTTVVGNMQHIPRFSGNSTDFSLTIQNVTLSDSSAYLCRVFVTNPIGNDWIVDSDPIRLCVYDVNNTSVSVVNRCAVTSTPAVSLSTVSPLAPSTTSVSSSVSITTNTTSMMKPHSHSLLKKLYVVTCIVVGSILIMSMCAVSGRIVFKVWNKRRSRHKLLAHKQSDNAVELGEVRNSPTITCDQEDQVSIQDEENCSLQVQVGDRSLVLESAGDNTASRGASPSDNQIQEFQNLEIPLEFESLECAATMNKVQPASTTAQLQSQEQTEPSLEETRDTPGSLPFLRSISETHQSNMHTPSGGAQFGRQSRQDSGLAMVSPSSDMPSNSTRSCPNRNTETVPLQSIDDFQVDSNELMFLGPVRVLVCDIRGGRFSIPEHGVTLSFPQGAVPDTIEIEVGVAIHGLFDFPDDLRPISVLVWVQAKTPEFEFQKPVEISLPHFLKLCKNDTHDNSSNLGLGFMVTDGEEDGHGHHHLVFKEGAKEQVSYKQTRAIISTTHFCYMCLSAKSSVIAEKGCYLLTQVQLEPITSLRWQIHFCVSYNLTSFVEMIKQQYRSQGKVVSQKPFQFAPSPTGKEPELKICFQSLIKGWQLILPTYKTIKQCDVELWEDDVSMLQSRIMCDSFPPRVTVEVAGEGAFDNTIQLFLFEGVHPALESEVHLCLPAEHVAQHKDTLQYLESRFAIISQQEHSLPMRAITPYHSCPGDMISLPQNQVHPDEPTEQELGEVMKVITTMGPNWRTLIGVLGIPLDKEQEILQDNIGLKTQILRMLQTWRILHRCDGTSTRSHLATILREADPCLHPAVKILENHCHS